MNNYSIFVKQTPELQKDTLEVLLYKNKIRNVKLVNHHYGKFEIYFISDNPDIQSAIVISLKQLNAALPPATILEVGTLSIPKTNLRCINSVIKTVNWLNTAEDKDAPAIKEVRSLLEKTLTKDKQTFDHQL